jgi:hypothetical protein
MITPVSKVRACTNAVTFTDGVLTALEEAEAR